MIYRSAHYSPANQHMSCLLRSRGNRREIAQMSLYTARFIEQRIEASWPDKGKSWVSRDL